MGNLPDFRRDRLAFLTNAARTYGDVAAFRLGQRRVYLVSHPDLLEQVLVTANRQFIKHFALRLNPLVFGKGLLTSEGDFWLRQRRLMQPAFQRLRVATYAPIMVDLTEQMLRRWQPGQACDIHNEMMQLTLAIAARTLFDAEAGSKADEVREALKVLQDSFLVRFNRLLPTPTWVPTPHNLQLKRAIRRLDNLLYQFIQQRRRSGETHRDLLSLLLEARDEQDHTGMNDKQLRDEMMTLFLAGHETTALSLSWTWYLLAQHPEVAARLAAEVDALGTRSLAFEDLPKLAYTETVVLESMRLCPPVYTIGREALEPCTLGGYHVPAGTTLLMSQWVLHHDPRFWEEPDRFLPERWTEANEQRRPRFAYFPFGAGPRVCIGNHFALMETVLVLATIAAKYRFTLQAEQTIKPVPTFTLRPSPGIPAVLTAR